jgi:hypothetical protein
MGLLLQDDPWSAALRNTLPALVPLGLIGATQNYFFAGISALRLLPRAQLGHFFTVHAAAFGVPSRCAFWLVAA